MQELHTTADVIAELGGADAVAELTGSNKKAVSMWKTAKRFPWHTQLPITDALRARRKIAPISLWGMKARVAAE